jgi:serine/threonine-protein kinase
MTPQRKAQMLNTNDHLRAIDEDTIVDSSPKGAVSVGETINGKYAITSQIGKGGMGRVFQAEDITLGRRKVALKVIDFPTWDPAKRLDIIERFRREAVAAARVSHPNVIVIYSFKEIAGEHVQVMEYIDGRTLKEELMAQPKKAMTPERAVKIIIEFLRGVSALHAAGLCHRDLKPTNIMLTHDGDRVKILDLGLVKFAEHDDPASDKTLTQCGIPMGSPLYMAPEQINALPDARNINTRTDIYAVGVILFQLLTGKTPFAEQMNRSLFDQHLYDKVPEMVSPFGELLPALQAIVDKAMSKKSGDRYESADAMREALKRLMRPPVQRSNRWATLGTTLIGPTLVAIAALVILLGRPQSQPAQISVSKQEVVEKRSDSNIAQPISTPKVEVPVNAAVSESPSETTMNASMTVTTKAGCEAYVNARTSEAVSILTRVITNSPNDADAYFCLCGAYARKPSLSADEREVCKSFLSRASKLDKRRLQATMWLKPGIR